jgi:hypothetical protein
MYAHFSLQKNRSLETLATCRQRGGRFGSEKLAQSTSWSPKRQKFLIIARLRRSLAPTPNIRSVRCMLIFHDKVDRSLRRWQAADSGVAGLAAGAHPLQGAGSRTVLRTTLGGRPPPRVPFVSASLIIARLRRSLASSPTTPNIRSVRCMVIFHNKINRSLETLASCRQRGGRFGRGSVPVARGRLQNGAANDPWRSATTARAVRVRELPRASPNPVQKIPEAPGAQSS